MPLQRGPFVLQSDSSLLSESGVYDFSNDALTLAGELQGIGSGWDTAIAGFDALASDPLEDLEAFDMNGLLGAISAGYEAAAVPAIDDTLSFFGDGETQLAAAVAFAPAQAWQDPPAPYVPPGPDLTLTVPTIPPAVFDVSKLGIVGATGSDFRPQAKLWNFTRIGSSNFIVGDTWEVAVLGNPGQVASVGGALNGVDLGRTVQGTLDSNGNLGLQGVMSPEVVGVWHEDWYLDDVPITSFNFIVAPAVT